MVDAPEIPLILLRKIDNRLDTAVGQLGVFSSWFNRAPPTLACPVRGKINGKSTIRPKGMRLGLLTKHQPLLQSSFLTARDAQGS